MASSGERTNSSGDQALSTAASAGIGFGVGLNVVTLAAAAFGFWLGRRKNSKTVEKDDRWSVKHGGSEVKSPQELQGYSTVPEIESRARLQEVRDEGMDVPSMEGGCVQPNLAVESA